MTSARNSYVHGEPTSRRRFLAGLTAFTFSPLLMASLPGCRRSALSGEAGAIGEVDAVSSRPPIPRVEPFIRVRIARVKARDIEAEVDAISAADANDAELHVTIGESGQMLRILQPDHMKRHIAAHGPVEIEIGPGGWSIIDGRGFRLPVYELALFLVLPLDRQVDGEHLAMNGRSYPGMLTLVPMTHINAAAFDVINHVQMEQYLPGVVERELYNHWHFETHAAQAIAARSFACAERAWWANRRHFDLTDTQASQVYAGAVTHQRSLDAVAETRGLVLAHDEHLVPGYYSSCCGGVPARAIDAIGPNPINDIPPLHGNGNGEEDLCRSAPVARWQVKYSRQVIAQRLARFGQAGNETELAALKSLRAIDVAAVNQHGRPTRYVLIDSAGTEAMIGAETLRRAINTADGRMARLPRPLRSSHITVEAAGGDFIFNGRGFGHGVGMCQHGAQLRAANGADREQILKWYYPGAKIVRAYA